MSVSLNSLLDRLGLEDEGMRTCVWIAFMQEQQQLTDEEVRNCLAWVVAVQEGRMTLLTFHGHLRQFIKEPLDQQELEQVARCMLSGHPTPDGE